MNFTARELFGAGDEDYFQGDRIRYTGKEEDLYGGHWYEFEYLEGPKKGKKGLSPRLPGQTDPSVARSQDDFKRQQEQFRRLAGKGDQTPGHS